MMYEGLAGIYDALAGDFNYGEWASRYERLLLSKCACIREICDAGCGTGALTLPLARKGYRLIGVDLSERMLQTAADKARCAGLSIPFTRQDMRTLSLGHPVDGLFSACDGVNYLTSLKSADAFFRSAFRALKPGGAFAFDISTEKKLLEMAKTGLYALDSEEMSYIWSNAFDESRRLITMEISFFTKQTGGHYSKFHETHVQRAHSQTEILDLLHLAGFEDISQEEAENGKRLYFAARKPQ